MHEFVVWLAGTAGSAALRTSDAALAWVESFHIFSIAVFVGTLAMVDFRLLGWSFRNVLVSEMTSRVLPWSIGAFSVVVTSGVLLFYASPVRAFHSVWFRLKVLLLLAGLVNAALFHYRVSRDRQRWDYARTAHTGPVCGRRLAHGLVPGYRMRTPHRVSVVRLRTAAKLLRDMARRVSRV